MPVYIFSLRHQRCHSFQYFEQFIEIFLEKVKFSFTFVEIDTDPDQDLQALELIRIRQTDADPTGYRTTPLPKFSKQKYMLNFYSIMATLEQTMNLLSTIFGS